MKGLVQFIMLVTFASLFSCSKNIDILPESDFLNKEVTNIASLKISPNITEISSTDAANVAKLMGFYNSAGTKSGISKEIKSIVTIYHENGSPAAYVVNYMDNKGYTIVSATKNYYPILADVEIGNYDENIKYTGVQTLVESYKAHIGNLSNLPSDSLAGMRKLWLPFENLGLSLPAITKSADDIRGDQVSEWNSYGYDVYSLSDAGGILPADIYQQFCDIAMVNCNPEYDYLSNSVVVEHPYDNSYRPTPMLSTSWAQGSPYNLSCPLKEGTRTLVGCGAIAAGQIMKYHQWPSNKNWGAMPDILTASGASVLSNFLYEVAEAIDTDFDVSLSYSLAIDIESALEGTYSYLTDGWKAYSATSVQNSLANNRPVLLLGQKDTNNDEVSEGGHYWVCDKYSNVQPGKTYTLYVTSYSLPLQFEQTNCTYDDLYAPYSIYHMNWGWGGTHDGWYINKGFPANNNYSFDMINLTNVRPNN